MNIIRSLFLSSFFICSALLSAAQTGSVAGFVNSPDSKPIDAATISLLKLKDSSLVRSGISAADGSFKIEKLPAGDYLIKIDAVGYNSFYSKKISIRADNANIVLGQMVLSSANETLASVNVTATRPLIENKIDKTVVNVDASPTNTGLSALEVLEKSPGITIDNDGNISLKGKSGVRVFIDGKPAYLSGQELNNYLKNLPSNQLEQIEIMSQPPAKI